MPQYDICWVWLPMHDVARIWNNGKKVSEKWTHTKQNMHETPRRCMIDPDGKPLKGFLLASGSTWWHVIGSASIWEHPKTSEKIEHLGAFRNTGNIWEAFGALWTSEKGVWGHLEESVIFWNTWKHQRSSGNIWQHRTFWGIWKLLVASGKFGDIPPGDKSAGFAEWEIVLWEVSRMGRQCCFYEIKIDTTVCTNVFQSIKFRLCLWQREPHLSIDIASSFCEFL